MIKYAEPMNLPLATNRLLRCLQNIAVQPYRLLRCGYIHNYELQSWPNFRLMEGVIFPPHSDGIVGYRPILMLRNPSNSYTIRGPDKYFLLKGEVRWSS